MHSKNKPAMNASQRKYVNKLAELPCVVCGAHGVEVHEFTQALFASSGLPGNATAARMAGTAQGDAGAQSCRHGWAIDRAVGGVLRGCCDGSHDHPSLFAIPGASGNEKAWELVKAMLVAGQDGAGSQAGDAQPRTEPASLGNADRH